ncbi:MAG TPA: hypothetical protein VFV34_03890 [Blastocatellia bacterium]|nr:hypothetical protein [Blastocatellia bacterium]
MPFQVTATNITASGTTGGTCFKSGPYRSGSAVVVYFKQGDKFTVDPANGKSTTWSMLKTADTLATSATV